MSELITLDEAIEWGKRGELCDLMTEDDQRQIAEWLRQARWADAAMRWYTKKIRELEDERERMFKSNVEKNNEVLRLLAENAKLREQIETLVMYVESDGTKYWVDDDGNQHFDHSAVKDDAAELRELGVDV